MAGIVRQVRPGVWEMRVYTGRDPLTGKKTQASRHVRASGKREAQAQCDRWAIELSDGDVVRAAGTFGDLCAQWIAVKERRWPPNTLQEHRRIVAPNLRALRDVDVAKITTHTLDVLYAELDALVLDADEAEPFQPAQRPSDRRLLAERSPEPGGSGESR